MNRTGDIGSCGENKEYLEGMTGVCQGGCLFLLPQIEMDGVEQGLMGKDGSQRVVLSVN